MGLFDKIKKAIDDSGVVDAAKVAVKSFTESTESKTIETPQKQIVEEKVAEKEVKETKPKAPPKPACEYGECVVCPCTMGKELFYTCEASVKCDKKAKYKAGDLWDRDMLPVVKAYTALKNYRGDWNAHEAAKRKLANAMINTYVPALKKYDFTTYVSEWVEYAGLGKNNPLLCYFVNLKRRNFEFKEDKKDAYITVAKIVNKEYNWCIDLEKADWLYNPSLYDSDELTYVTKAFMRFSNTEYLKTHILDTSVIDLNEFYNEDGTIKTGGSDGRDGDTIYNIVERWCDGNENLETFAEEQRIREEEQRQKQEKERRMKICKACVRYDTCQVVGLQENCSAFIPR